MNISIDLAEKYASNAGFSLMSTRIIVAIAQAESGLNPLWEHINSDGSLDRGILQINNYWHAEVSDKDAFDPAMAFVQGYRISKQGTDFTPWTTFISSDYLSFISRVPDGWIDDGVTLTNSINNFIVEKGFRQYILSSLWASWDVPLENAVLVSPGGRQITRAHVLQWNSINNLVYQVDTLGDRLILP